MPNAIESKNGIKCFYQIGVLVKFYTNCVIEDADGQLSLASAKIIPLQIEELHIY